VSKQTIYTALEKGQLLDQERTRSSLRLCFKFHLVLGWAMASDW